MKTPVVTGLGVLLILGAAAGARADEASTAAPKTLWQEINWFGYVENSVVANLRGKTFIGTNELRLYDVDRGYTFNMVELSVKKDPSDRYPFGFGLVLTGGEDVQFNHAIGVFRDADEAPTDTDKFDVQEAYLAYKVPVGSGLTLKGGKFVTLLGYEVIESPNNLNFSRSYLFEFAVPFTNVGLLGSYTLNDAWSVTAGPVLGWDVATDRNGAPSGMGQVAYTGVKDLSTAVNFIVGPEKNATVGTTNMRWVVDLTATYTGVAKTALGANVDYGWEQDAVAPGQDATWWGLAGYAAYDWTERLRTAARGEYFYDGDGYRTGVGQTVKLWEATATVQYKIWRGLVGRLEYRHDQADHPVFQQGTGKSQDTIAIDLYYSFF